MVIGDLNARIGSDEGRENRYAGKTRNSKDSVINARGVKLLDLCNSFGFQILNGVSKSDELGEFTFIGQQGSSVIDYCLIRGNWIQIITDFEVLSVPYSDHMPVTVYFGAEIVEQEQTSNLSFPPRLKWMNNKAEEYRCNLEFIISTDIETNLSELENAIKASCPSNNNTKKLKHKEKWYDAECEQARRKSFGWLKAFRKYSGSYFKKMYIEANVMYKKICREKKLRFLETEALQLTNCKDTREFWKGVNFINGKKPQISTKINTYSLHDHFKQLLNSVNLTQPIYYAKPKYENEILDCLIRREEIRNVLKKLRDGKAAGADGIPVEFIKYGTETLINQLISIYNTIMNTGESPKEFKKCIIFPIHKKGNISDPANYRGISFLNSFYKIFTTILNDRLTNWIHSRKLLVEFQAGFRCGYSTMDNIFVLQSITCNFYDQKKKLYAFFVDFKAAFDTVDRRALFYKLYNVGMSEKFGKVLENLYNGNISAVWNGSETSEWFETKMGVKQGCSLSPSHFNIFINDLLDLLPGGIEISGMTIKALLFADDVVMFSRSPQTLQLMINRLQSYCQTWNLKVNLSKSKIMIFRKGPGRTARNEKWYFNREEIEVVKNYKYLGVTISSNLSIETHLKNKLVIAKSAISATWKQCFTNKSLSHCVKYKIFVAVAESIMLYGSQIWGGEKYETVEKLLRYFIKKCFRLPRTTPNYMINIETGLPPLFIKTVENHVEYILKVLDMPDERLPKILALDAIRKKNVWYPKLEELGRYCQINVRFQNENRRYLREDLQNLVSKLDEQYRTDCIHQASSSIYRSVYSRLNHNLSELNYFKVENTQDLISSIFKMRGELVNLNYIPHRDDLPILCSLCNLSEREDVIHFIGKCPVLSEIRRFFLNSSYISEEEILSLLNCESNTANLYNFYQCAMSYRNRIINEAFYLKTTV